MKKPLLTSLLILLLLMCGQWAVACSCVNDLPESFCESLRFRPEPYRPTAVVLAVKLNDVAHGMDMKVVDVIQGYAPDTIRVWGDPGHLCRPYTSGIPVGDTMIIALDSLTYFYDVEDTGHYEINICGVYTVDYINGMASGFMFSPNYSQVTYAFFKDLLVSSNCFEYTDLVEVPLDDLSIKYSPKRHELLLEGGQLPWQVNVYETTGKLLATDTAEAGRQQYPLAELPAGVYIVEVLSGMARAVQRIVVAE